MSGSSKKDAMPDRGQSSSGGDISRARPHNAGASSSRGSAPVSASVVPDRGQSISGGDISTARRHNAGASSSRGSDPVDELSAVLRALRVVDEIPINNFFPSARRTPSEIIDASEQEEDSEGAAEITDAEQENSEGVEATANQQPERWKSYTDGDLHPFSNACNAEAHRRLRRLVLRAKTSVDTFDFLKPERPSEEQRSTSIRRGIIETSRLGGDNDFILGLTGSVDVRLLYVARSDSTFEELDALYPRGARVAVTRHYPEETFFAVDNPEDVKIETCFPTELEQLLEKGATELRMLGNEHFKKKSYVPALELYKLSILRSDGSDKLLALSNGAECLLELGQFSQALGNAEAALALTANTPGIPATTLVKILTRKARALHGTLMYQGAVDAYRQALRDCTAAERSDILKRMENSERRDISDGLHRYLSRGCRSEDAPTFLDYVGPVQIRARSAGGIGLFATKDIAAGEVLIISNAVGFVPGIPTGIECDDVYVIVLRAALYSPRTMAQLSFLWDKLVGKDATKIPDMSLFTPDSDLSPIEAARRSLDVDKIWDILKYNFCFGLLGGVWTLPGFINHDCSGNLCVVQVGQAKIFRADGPILRGTELTYCYAPAYQILPLMYRSSFFTGCTCNRCFAEMYAKQHHDGYRRLEARYTTHLWEYMRRIDDVHHQDMRQAAVEEELVTVGVELEGILRETGWHKMQQMQLRMSFAVSYFLYFLYKERYVASSQGELRSASMPDDTGLLTSFMETCSRSLETMELLLLGVIPLTFYPRMQRLRTSPETDADRALEYCFKIRYGEEMSKNAKLQFVKWLQSDEPGKWTKA